MRTRNRRIFNKPGTPPSGGTLPSADTITASALTTTSLTASVTSAGSGAATRRWQISANAGATYTTDATDALASHTYSGLTPSTSYKRRTITVNATGDGPASNVLTTSTAAAGSAPAVSNGKVLNPGIPRFFIGNANPFVNYLFGAGSGWTTGTADSGWAQNVGAGATSTLGFWAGGNAFPARTGRWVLTCQAPFTPSYSFGGVTIANAVTVNAQRKEFDIVGFDAIFTGSITITNTSGALVADSGTVAMFLLSEEADLNAGKVLSVPGQAALSQSTCLRPMDWCSVNFGNFTTAAAVPTGVLSNYVRYDNAFPPELMARAAAEAGVAVLWITVPVQFTIADYSVWAARWKAATDAAGFTGKVLPELGNELWNFGFPAGARMDDYGAVDALVQRQYDGTIVSAYDRGLSGRASYAYRSRKVWAAFEAQYGRSRVFRTLSLQAVYFESYGHCLHWVDPATGERIADIVDAVAVAPYFNLDGMNEARKTEFGIVGFDSGTQYSAFKQYTGDLYTKDNTWFTNAYKAAMKSAADGVTTMRSKFSQYGLPDIPLIAYEGGSHEFFLPTDLSAAKLPPSFGLSGDYGSSTAVVTANVSLNRLDIAPPSSTYRTFAPLFNNGDRVAWTYQTGSGDSGPIAASSFGDNASWVVTVYVKRVNGDNSLELYSDAALTARITIVAGPHPDYGIYNATRLKIILNKMYGLLDSDAGAALQTTYYWDALRAAGLKWIAQYSDVATLDNDRPASHYNGSFGIRNGYYTPDSDALNARWRAWKVFT